MTREIVASKKQDWATPRWLFDVLHAESDFTLDLCAASYNACLPRWLGPDGEQPNGLEAMWTGERGFGNPPYEDIESWLKRAIMMCAEGAYTRWLIPANTDTGWFHAYAVLGQIDFFKGRLKFEDLTPPEIELQRILGVLKAKGKPYASNLLKQLALLLNELDPDMQLVKLAKLNTYEGDNPVEEAAWVCHNNIRTAAWPTDIRKPGPGFPSMLVTFDPAAAAGPRTFRTRSAKTGELL